MAGRPLSRKAIGDLRALAVDPANWASVLHELGYRNTQKARKLAAEIRDAMGKPTSTTAMKAAARSVKPTAAERTARAAKKARSAAVGTATSPEAVPAPEVRDLQERFDLLRATFSLTGEVLARWGMTPTMPREIRDQVFGLWGQRLRDGDIDAQRTRTRLDEDIVTLEAEERSEGGA